MKKIICTLKDSVEESLVNFRDVRRVGILCSSGPDSMALLDVFNTLKEKYNFKLLVLNVDNGNPKTKEVIENYVTKNNLELIYTIIN